MRPIIETLDNWAEGVISAVQPHQIDPAASPRAWNTVLSGAGEGRAVFAKRRGLRLKNASPVSSSPAILGQADFRRASGGTFTPYHLLISNNGRFDKLQSDDTVTAADVSAAAPFTSGDKYPDSTIARNYLYIVNGTDAKKFDGTTVYSFSQSTPAAPSSVVDSGVAGTPNGTYEAVIAYYNSNTGYYSSSSSGVSVTVASRQIDINWAAPADPQVTHVVVGIRNTANQPRHYEVTKIAIGTTTYRYNGDSSTLTTLMPDQDENDPLPSGVAAIEWHQGARRMFATDGTTLFYSGRDKPEAFDPESVESVGQNDGQKIVALHYAHDVLLIIKTRSTYILIGQDPEEWRVELLDNAVGTSSFRSVFTTPSTERLPAVTYWWSEQGAVAWPGAGAVVNIMGRLRPDIHPDSLNYSQFHLVVGAPDTENRLAVWAVPTSGQTRNTILFPFNYELGKWVSNKWDPLDAASLALVRKVTDDTPRLFLGGYKGQVFEFDSGVGNDGLPSGTTSSGSVTSSTNSTLTDSGAAFTTSGGALIERYVTAIDPAGTRVQRRRITSNTATELTISPNWSTNPGEGWTYVVGGPEFQLDTRLNFGDLPFIKKRFIFLFLLAGSINSAVELTVHLFKNQNTNASAPDKSITGVQITGSGAQWDTATWDSSQWAGLASSLPKRLRVAMTGLGWRARFINRNVNEDVAIHSVAMKSELLSDHLS